MQLDRLLVCLEKLASSQRPTDKPTENAEERPVFDALRKLLIRFPRRQIVDQEIEFTLEPFIREFGDAQTSLQLCINTMFNEAVDSSVNRALWNRLLLTEGMTWQERRNYAQSVPTREGDGLTHRFARLLLLAWERRSAEIQVVPPTSAAARRQEIVNAATEVWAWTYRLHVVQEEIDWPGDLNNQAHQAVLEQLRPQEAVSTYTFQLLARIAALVDSQSDSNKTHEPRAIFRRCLPFRQTGHELLLELGMSTQNMKYAKFQEVVASQDLYRRLQGIWHGFLSNPENEVYWSNGGRLHRGLRQLVQMVALDTEPSVSVVQNTVTSLREFATTFHAHKADVFNDLYDKPAPSKREVLLDIDLNAAINAAPTFDSRAACVAVVMPTP